MDQIKDPPETFRPKASMEEVEDEFWQEYYKLPKSLHHILDDNESNGEALKEGYFTKAQKQDGPPLEELPHQPPPIMEPPPTNHGKPIRLLKKRFKPDGTSAVGVSVLAIKGWIGSKGNDRIDLRLDSCADITLLSEEYYRTLRDKPPLRAGMKLRLWQLTDKDSSIQGFVKIPVTMIGEDGELFEAEAEAYVVPGMTVPILLGEDFQLTYELGVTRNVEEGTYIHFGQTDYKVRAQAVERTNDFGRLRQSAMAVGHFIRAKLHRRNKAKRRRKKVKFGIDQTIVRAAEDFKLRPHECRPIRVEGQLGGVVPTTFMINHSQLPARRFDLCLGFYEMYLIPFQGLFHSYLIAISFLPNYYFIVFPALFHSYFISISFQSYFISVSFLPSYYFIAFPALFHSYFISILFLFHSYFIPISFPFQSYFISVSLLPSYYFITFPALFQSYFNPISFHPISFLFHSFLGIISLPSQLYFIPISFLFHFYFNPISFQFHFHINPISFLFHYFLATISLPSQLYFISISFQSYFISVSFLASYYFIAFPALFHSYFIPISFLFQSYFISISFPYQSYFISISFLPSYYFITFPALFHFNPISFLFHSLLAIISLPSQLYFIPISFLFHFYFIPISFQFHFHINPISFLFHSCFIAISFSISFLFHYPGKIKQ